MAKKPHDPTFTIDRYVSSTTGLTLEPQGKALMHERLMEQQTVFAFEEYARRIHMPLPLPHIDLAPLRASYPRCLDMPLRLAGEHDYHLPEEWTGLASLLEHLIAQEHATNPNWAEYHTYLTIDCKMVHAAEQQRHGGLHVDGFQGARIQPKTRITRNYVMTTNGGTRFYPQRFIVADETRFNVFQGFDIQAERYEIAEENVAYFMDAYCVHESGIAERDALRTFLRLTYDLKRFDRAGNTHNAMLDYDWPMVGRAVHETVATPNYIDLENSPYFPEGEM